MKRNVKFKIQIEVYNKIVYNNKFSEDSKYLLESQIGSQSLTVLQFLQNENNK